MEKLTTILLLLTSLTLTSMPGSNAETRAANPDESEIQHRCFGKEKVTNLHFYLQDLIRGKKQSVWKVAQSNLTYKLPSLFGLVAVLDSQVTARPEMSSREVGRIQGIIGLSDFDERALVMVLNLVFTKGEYKGSTLSIVGRNPLDEKVREVSIVGGTGAFRMARGYAFIKTYSDDLKTHAVYEYNVVVSHFQGSRC